MDLENVMQCNKMKLMVTNFVRVVCLWRGSLCSFLFALETQADHLKDVHFSGLIYPLYLLPYIYLGRDAINLTLRSV